MAVARLSPGVVAASLRRARLVPAGLRPGDADVAVQGAVEFLVAEEHDAMLVQGVADLTARAVVERLRHVDAEQLRTAGAGDRLHLESAVAHQEVSFRSSSARFHAASVAAAS